MIKKVKQILPNFILSILYSILHNLRVIYYKGKKFTCPICNYQASQFLAYGTDNEAVKKYNIIPMGYRKYAICPKCYSKDRERLIYLFIQSLLKKNLIGYNSKIIHFAPEKSIEKNLFRKKFSNYITADIFGNNVDFNLDLQNLSFTQSNFDLVICNHVLEHIDDDTKALENIFNLLSPYGLAILQVPFSKKIKKDFKIDNVDSNEDRLKFYGQEDHVRIYSEIEYVEKLKKAGFKVEIDDMKNYKTHKPSYGLNYLENVFFLKK
jgi:predicted SAM-dependent methyltransferase